MNSDDPNDQWWFDDMEQVEKALIKFSEYLTKNNWHVCESNIDSAIEIMERYKQLVE